MANEASVTVSLTFAKGNFPSLLRQVSSLLRDVSGSPLPALHTQMVGTTEEALDLGDIVTPGLMLLVNRDSTNYISVRSGTGAANLIKLKAGDPALFRCEATAPFVIANTAGCILEIYALPD